MWVASHAAGASLAAAEDPRLRLPGVATTDDAIDPVAVRNPCGMSDSSNVLDRPRSLGVIDGVRDRGEGVLGDDVGAAAAPSPVAVAGGTFVLMDRMVRSHLVGHDMI